MTPPIIGLLLLILMLCAGRILGLRLIRAVVPAVMATTLLLAAMLATAGYYLGGSNVMGWALLHTITVTVGWLCLVIAAVLARPASPQVRRSDPEVEEYLAHRDRERRAAMRLRLAGEPADADESTGPGGGS